MPNTVLYVCPDCEPGPYMFAGKIISKVCSRCADQRQNAKTGYDRAETGLDRALRAFEQRLEARQQADRGLREAFSRPRRWPSKLS